LEKIQKYYTVKLPEELGAEIDNAIRHEAKNQGYSSRAEFVKDAIRSFLRQFKEAE